MLAPDKKKFLLERACERARLDYSEIVQAAKDGRAQFHETDNGVAVTSITTSGIWHVCWVLLLAGTKKGVAELHPIILEFAKKSGCNIIRADAREGFERKRKTEFAPISEGFVPVGIIYEKVIPNE